MFEMIVKFNSLKKKHVQNKEDSIKYSAIRKMIKDQSKLFSNGYSKHDFHTIIPVLASSEGDNIPQPFLSEYIYKPFLEFLERIFENKSD